MKKIALLTLILTSAVFAKDGDADALASLVLGVIGIIVFLYGICFIIGLIGVILEGICNFLENLWENCNSFGRIVLFGIPLFAIVTTAFYFLIYSVLVPAASFYISHCNLAEYKLWIQIGAISVLYLSLIPLGWKIDLEYGITGKRIGVICWLARMFVLLPFAPLIIICKFLFESFATAFISKHSFSINLELFAIVHPIKKNKGHNGQIIPMIDKVLG